MAVAFVSTPAATIKAATSSGSFASFSPNAGSGYLVVVSLDTNQSGVSASTVAWASGGSGTWKKLKSFNFNQFGATIEVWAVHCTTAPGASVISVTGNAFVTSIHSPIREMTGHDPTLPTTGGTATSSSATNTITCTPNTTGSRIVFGAMDRNEGFTATPNAATTMLDSWNNGGAESYAGFGASTTASTAQTLGVTNTVTGNIQLALEILPGAGSQTGVIAVAGAGAPAVAGLSSETAALAVSSAGAPSVAGSGTVTGVIAPSGAGAPAVAGLSAESGVVTVAGTGQAQLAGVRTQLGTVAAAGAGAVAVGQAQTESGALSVIGVGAVSLVGAVAESGSVAVGGSGAVTVGGTSAESGSVAVSGAGSVSVAGLSSETGSIAVQGAGAATFAGLSAESGVIPANGQGAVAVESQGLQQGTIAPAGAGNVTVAGSVQETGGIAPTGSGLVTVASAGGSQTGVVAVNGVGAVTVFPGVAEVGTIAVNAAAAVVVGPTHIVAFTVQINETASVTVAGSTAGTQVGGIAIVEVGQVTITATPSGVGILDPLRVRLGHERWRVELGDERWGTQLGRERWATRAGVDRVKKATFEYVPLLIDAPKHADIATVEYVISEAEAVPVPTTWSAAVQDPDGDWFAPAGPFAEAGTWFFNARVTGSTGEQAVKYAGYVQVED